jgi:hypothetical protein
MPRSHEKTRKDVKNASVVHMEDTFCTAKTTVRHTFRNLTCCRCCGNVGIPCSVDEEDDDGSANSMGKHHAVSLFVSSCSDDIAHSTMEVLIDGKVFFCPYVLCVKGKRRQT